MEEQHVSDTGDHQDDGTFQARDDGQLHFEKGTEDWVFPVTAPEDATPLEEDEPEGTVPPSPLWAMKERAHGGLHLFGHPARIRACAGTGDAAVYAVGATTDGCVYSLIGRVDLSTWQDLERGAVDGRAAFAAAHELGLSGTIDADGVSNVFDVDWYDGPDDVPADYLPPSPFHTFAEDLPTADR
jgi:hypothetical protein